MVIVKGAEIKNGWKACSSRYHKATNTEGKLNLAVNNCKLQVMPTDFGEITNI